MSEGDDAMPFIVCQNCDRELAVCRHVRAAWQGANRAADAKAALQIALQELGQQALGEGSRGSAEAACKIVRAALRTAPEPATPRPSTVTVCAACGSSACWAGDLMCEQAYEAGVAHVPLEQDTARARTL